MTFNSKMKWIALAQSRRWCCTRKIYEKTTFFHRRQLRTNKSMDSPKRTVVLRHKKVIWKKKKSPLSSAKEAQVKQEITMQEYALTLPLSSRSVGFITQELFQTSYSLYKNIPICTPWSFYRVSLGQLELKLVLSGTKYLGKHYEDGDFYRPRMCLDFRDILRNMVVKIPPMVNLLHSVGHFECNGKKFNIQPLNHRTLGVLLSNLRATVTTMADANTPVAIRMEFYEHNPLPYAQWTVPVTDAEESPGARSGDPNHPLLLNPDAIMPPDYDVEDLEKDVHAYRNFVWYLSKKNSGLTSEGQFCIDYERNGHRRQLVSNYMTGFYNPYWVPVSADVDYSKIGRPSGNLDEFWSFEVISRNEMVVGALNLLGEIPKPTLYNRAQAIRFEEIAARTIKIRYRQLLTSALNELNFNSY